MGVRLGRQTAGEHNPGMEVQPIRCFPPAGDFSPPDAPCRGNEGREQKTPGQQLRATGPGACSSQGGRSPKACHICHARSAPARPLQPACLPACLWLPPRCLPSAAGPLAGVLLWVTTARLVVLPRISFVFHTMTLLLSCAMSTQDTRGCAVPTFHVARSFSLGRCPQVQMRSVPLLLLAVAGPSPLFL